MGAPRYPDRRGLLPTTDDGRPFAPTQDLVAIAEAVITLVERDVWRVRDVTTGSDLPTVWVSAGAVNVLQRRRFKCCGCVTVGCALLVLGVAWRCKPTPTDIRRGGIRPRQTPRSSPGERGPGPKGGFVGLGVQGRCAWLWSRGFVSGVTSYERGPSLDRLEAGLLAILTQHGLK